MTNLLPALLAILASSALLPTLAFSTQIFSASILPRRRHDAPARTPSFAVILPAHDEEAGIGETVRRLSAVMPSPRRLLVVADNCSDRTAQVAKEAGAEVLVRNDRSRRGKGFALAAGVRHLALSPPDVVVFVDADCRFTRGGPAEIASAAFDWNAPVQCLNLMTGDRGSKLQEFAWTIKNDLRPEGFARLSLPCQLTGTGMAIPWRQLRVEALETSHVTEDVLIGLDCALRGHAPRFLSTTRIVSSFPTTQSGCADQKRRWLHGHLALIAKQAPHAALVGLAAGNLQALALAADLMVPPLTILAALHFIAVAGGLMGAWLLNARAPLSEALLGAGLFCAAIGVAWVARGRGVVGWAELRQVPRHAFRVIAQGGQFVIGQRSRWVRAAR